MAGRSRAGPETTLAAFLAAVFLPLPLPVAPLLLAPALVLLLLLSALVLFFAGPGAWRLLFSPLVLVSVSVWFQISTAGMLLEVLSATSMKVVL